MKMGPARKMICYMPTMPTVTPALGLQSQRAPDSPGVVERRPRRVWPPARCSPHIITTEQRARRPRTRTVRGRPERGDLSPHSPQATQSARDTEREPGSRSSRVSTVAASLPQCRNPWLRATLSLQLRACAHSKSARSHAASHEWSSQKESARYAPEEKGMSNVYRRFQPLE